MIQRKISRSAWRRAKDAEQRVLSAFNAAKSLRP